MSMLGLFCLVECEYLLNLGIAWQEKQKENILVN